MESTNQNTAPLQATADSEADFDFSNELSSRPETGPRGYYFPWSVSSSCYDKSSYNPVYSGGKISQRDIDALVADVESHPLQDPTVGHSSTVVSVVVIFFAMVIVCGLILVFGDLSNNFWMIFAAMIIGMLLIIAAVACCSMRQKSRSRDRRNAMDQIMRRHNDTTFAGKGAFAKMSALGSYVAVEFSFEGALSRGFFQVELPFLSPAGYFAPQPNPYGNLNQYAQTGGFNQPVAYS